MPWNFLPVLHMQDRKMWMTIQCMCIYSHYHLYHLINPYFMDEDFHWLQGRTVLSSKSNAWRTETKNCNVISVCVRRINMDKGCQSPKIASLCCYFFLVLNADGILFLVLVITGWVAGINPTVIFFIDGISFEVLYASLCFPVCLLFMHPSLR